LRWRNAHHTLKFRAEGAQAGIADFQADLRHGHFTGCQQVAGAVHTASGKEVMGRLAERGTEEAVEMKSGKAGFASGTIEKDLRLVAGSQKVAGATEATKSFVVHEPQWWIPLEHGFIVLRVRQQKSTENLRKTLAFQVCICHDSMRFV